MKKGAFDLDDLAEQLKQLQKLGGMSGVMGLLPGMGKIKKQLDNVDLDKLVLRRQMAIIGSMTVFERRNPKVLNASRKKRVAKGSGTEVQEVNRLLKMHLQMADMMKKMGKQRGGLLGSLFGGGQPAVDMAELERLQGELKTLDPAALPPELRNLPLEGGLPKGLPGLGAPGGLLPGLGGGGLPKPLGGGRPGFSGFPFKKK